MEMESSSRIPKSNIKPPSRIAKPSSSRPLPQISENVALAPTTVKVAPIPAAAFAPPRPLGALRRRSKSASDLRSLTTRDLNKRPIKPLDKPIHLRPGQKRAALHKNADDENTKPKVPKVKIPSWDYKARFQDLQPKHAALLEETKELRAKILDLPELQNELATLRQKDKSNVQKISELEKKAETWIQEESRLIEENHNLTTQLLKSDKELEKMQMLHDAEVATNQKHLTRIQSIENSLKLSENANQDLREELKKRDATNRSLKLSLDEQEEVRRHLHNTIQDLKGNIRVFCRVRPAVNKEELDRQLCAIWIPNESTLEIKKARESVSTFSGKTLDLKQEFSFDKVFGPQANQIEVFEELSQLVQSALDGYHVCVFAYGQTGSGKTFTMQGTDNSQGMIPRTIDLIFQKIHKLESTEWTYIVSASFLEIYNESIKDLLEPNSTYNYELRYNEGRGVTVTNLKIVPIESAFELKNLMDEAHKNRAVAATDFNEHSSRSHAVAKIYLEGYNNATRATYSGSINLVDLAGSESARTTSSERLHETKSINKSLSTLGSVMLALHNNDPHIPYRNSKLTYLLQSCLGGNSKTLMFVNISPFEECFSESINSLRFASKVKEVKIMAKKNKMYAGIPL